MFLPIEVLPVQDKMAMNSRLHTHQRSRTGPLPLNAVYWPEGIYTHTHTHTHTHIYIYIYIYTHTLNSPGMVKSISKLVWIQSIPSWNVAVLFRESLMLYFSFILHRIGQTLFLSLSLSIYIYIHTLPHWRGKLVGWAVWY